MIATDAATATRSRWPSHLWIVRHGESAGNVARDAANAAGAQRIELTARDVDIPLSARGEDQVRALGAWFARQPADERPDVIIASPYTRARASAELFRAAGGADPDVAICIDERLRMTGSSSTRLPADSPERRRPWRAGVSTYRDHRRDRG